MLNFKQLQTITKKEILKAFEDYFEVELKHPNGDSESNYFIQKTFVSQKTIKKIFKNRFEDKNLKFDLRRIDTWAEMFLQCREKITCTISKRDAHQKHYSKVNAKVAEDLAKLEMILKEMKLSVTNRLGSTFKSEGYNTRQLIKGTNLEIGYGSYLVDAAWNGERFLNHFQKTQRTFAIFERVVTKKYDANGYLTSIDDIKETEKSIVKFLTIEQLKVELPKVLEKLKKTS